MTALRVLLVDDSEDVIETLNDMVTLHGHETRTASSGSDALLIAATFRPHLVVLDLGMPEPDGFEVAQRIRATDWGARVMLVALSGWNDAATRARTAAAGFDRHYAKPITVEQVRDLLGSVALDQ